MKLIIKEIIQTDLPILLKLIKELAKYEKLLDQVSASENLLTQWIIKEKKANALLLEYNHEIVGFVLTFNNFSTFLGKPGIYLEDLYIKKAYRNKGFGKQVFRYLANECIQKGYGRLEWSVLDWNEPRIQFYKKLGALPMSDWTTYRLTESEFNKLI
ncbi:MAG TPA: GNAT family N-acetyltransferase [Erysipelotrichaceae bacterium]|nr:GNAT family N-acetyltransferase [Erysipelotrichaceae bacterium]